MSLIRQSKAESKYWIFVKFLNHGMSSSHLGLKDRKCFKETYLNPMIAEDLLIMAESDNPTSGNQSYISLGSK